MAQLGWLLMATPEPMSEQFWSGKKVFITGHTGFKGGWMSLWLTSLGAQVKGYALAPSTTPSFFESVGLAELVESEIGDVRDAAALAASVSGFEPDVVIHMAAQPLVRYSFDEPLETFEVNVMGTANLLQAIRGVASVRSVVNVTTDKCYENKEWHWAYRENEPLGGYDPYSASKACSELVTSAYRQSFFNPEDYRDHQCGVASARAGNVVGGGDWSPDRLLPDILRDFSNHQPVAIRNPHSIRPWQHVLEPLSGYLLLAQNLVSRGAEYSQAWNFGPDESGAKSVGDLVAEMVALWGGDAAWTSDDRSHPHEAQYLKLDCSKARNELGWHPRWDISQTLEAVVEWHQAFLAGENMREYSLAEIKRYATKP